MSTEKPLLIYDVVYPPDLSERIKSHGKYDVFTLALNKFENDKRHGGNFHYEWVGKVAMITEKILISERIQDSRNGSYSPRSTPKQSEGASEPDGKKVLIRLSDGTTKTKDVKDRLKELGFWWNTPAGSYDWNKVMNESDWQELREQEPFKDLTAEVSDA